MLAVCAWCGTTIAEGGPEGTSVSHGICPRCAREWFPGNTRYAVVPPDRSFLFAEIESAFQVVRGIQVILDRRRGERRQRNDPVRYNRRFPSRDRRRQPPLVVGALPAVRGLWLPVVRTTCSERFGGTQAQGNRTGLRGYLSRAPRRPARA